MAANSSKRTDGRSDPENPIGKNLANGHVVNASEQETPFLKGLSMVEDAHENTPEESQQTQTGVLHRCILCLGSGKKCERSTIGLSVLVGILISIIIYLWAKPCQMPAAASPPVTISPTLDPSPCPQGWVRNEGRCYLFSDTEETWNASQIACSSQGGSLVAMDTPQERQFLNGSQPLYFWLDLWREAVGKRWKRADGSLFSNTFPIAGDGLCAYMNEGNARSTSCDDISRHSICTTPVHGH